MTRIPIKVIEASDPPEPLHLKCSRVLALRLGALPRGYFCGTMFGDPVIMVEAANVGMIWPIHNGAYLGTNDKIGDGRVAGRGGKEAA